MDPKIFMLAGKAIFTVHNEKTDKRLTYKVVKKEGNDGKDIFFVSAQSGPSNLKFSYLGAIFESGKKFVRTKRSSWEPQSLECKGFKWLHAVIVSGKKLPDFVKFHHEGRCGRCGKRLTVPESIESGFGPECSKVMGI